MDVNIKKSIVLKFLTIQLTAGIVNVYDRHNLFYFVQSFLWKKANYILGLAAVLEFRFALAFVLRFIRNSLNSFSSLGVSGLFTKTKS
jgi:hypothetical protein